MDKFGIYWMYMFKHANFFCFWKWAWNLHAFTKMILSRLEFHNTIGEFLCWLKFDKYNEFFFKYWLFTIAEKIGLFFVYFSSSRRAIWETVDKVRYVSSIGGHLTTCLTTFLTTFTSHSIIFHSYWDVTIIGEGLHILTYTRQS